MCRRVILPQAESFLHLPRLVLPVGDELFHRILGLSLSPVYFEILLSLRARGEGPFFFPNLISRNIASAFLRPLFQR